MGHMDLTSELVRLLVLEAAETEDQLRGTRVEVSEAPVVLRRPRGFFFFAERTDISKPKGSDLVMRGHLLDALFDSEATF